MQRRAFLAGAAAALSRPALAAAGDARTLRFVPQANLTSLDPVWTTAAVTRNFGLMVYDTLYGIDSSLQPKPQMAEGHVVDDDGRRWTIRLRSGLMFHDGARVLGRDCAASVARWMKRDPLGQALAPRLDAIETPDDRTLVFRLNAPFPRLLTMVGKLTAAGIMPERLARTDAFAQLSEVVGSGPFRFVQNEFVSGSRAVFARADTYRPRDDAPDFCAGAKRAMVERVEWQVVPDASTAASALMAGEVDWIEQPLPDLLPLLRRSADVMVDRLDLIGLAPQCRPNMTQGPTANAGVRRAIMACIDQREVMQAVMGDDSTAYRAPVGALMPGRSGAGDAGMEHIGPKPVAEIHWMLDQAGYDGSSVVLLHPTDQTFYAAMSDVVLASLKRGGIKVDDQSMDWGTVVQRRVSKAPLSQGGWSLFCTSSPALDYLDPLTAGAIRANGAGAWWGWPSDDTQEALYKSWLYADNPAQEQSLAAQLQARALDQAWVIPLGQYFQSAAWRRSVTGFQKGPAPTFWNVAKA